MIRNDSLLLMADPGYSGESTIKLIASDGQSQVFQEFKVIRDVTGTGQDLADILSLHVYPNPISDFLRIELGINQFYYEPIFVEVYDLSGRQLRSETFEFSADGIPRHSVDMSDVPLGVYILNVRTGTIARSILVTKNSR